MNITKANKTKEEFECIRQTMVVFKVSKAEYATIKNLAELHVGTERGDFSKFLRMVTLDYATVKPKNIKEKNTNG